MRVLLVAAAFGIFLIPNASAEDDRYLAYIEENGEVIACSDRAVFDEAMLSTWSIEDFGAFCHPVMVTDLQDPKFDGWMFLDPPVWADGTESFAALRRYSGSVGDIPAYVLWPFPFDPADYGLFIGTVPAPAVITVPEVEIRYAAFAAGDPD